MILKKFATLSSMDSVATEISNDEIILVQFFPIDFRCTFLTDIYGNHFSKRLPAMEDNWNCNAKRFGKRYLCIGRQVELFCQELLQWQESGVLQQFKVCLVIFQLSRNVS
jgi:hypothetical protein